MRARRISDSAICSSLIIIAILSVLISCAGFSARICFAADLRILGLPDWLEIPVLRSVSAIWSEIPENMSREDRAATLKLVASRLFTGYEIEIDSRDVKFFRTGSGIVNPEINIMIPDLRDVTSEWFENDILGLREEIAELLEILPPDALTWADDAFRAECEKLVSKHVPGWDFNLQIFLSSDSSSVILNLAFRPSTPLILAIQPSLYSQTVPSMFRTDLEAKLIPELSPLIGVPVKWAEAHKAEIEKMSRAFLEDKHAVENMKANVNVNFTPAPVANLDAKIDSDRFMFQVWVAAYAGMKERYPEAGVFFAYRTSFHMMGHKFRPEIYTELVVELDDFDVIARPGIRVELFENFTAGLEFQVPDDEFYLRFAYMPLKVKRPYFWWRWNLESNNSEGAFGYRIDKHISTELYYQEGNRDKFGLRGLWFL